MTLPANIRINVGAPLPTTVKGSGPFAIQKKSGIWTVSMSVANLGTLQVGIDPNQVQIPVWNGVLQTWQVTTLAVLASGGLNPTIITSVQSPYTPKATDFFLLVDTTGGPVEIDLVPQAQRAGTALSIKDYKGNAAVNNITIKPVGGGAPEAVDGFTNAAPLVLNANYDGVRLVPIAGGYTIAP